MSKLKKLVIAFLVALLLQFISLDILENSIISNIPILSSFLTFFDALYTFSYIREGVTITNNIPLFFRIVSLCASLYAFSFLTDLGLPSSIEDNPLYNIIVIIFTMIPVHACFSYIMKSIYLPIFHMLNRSIEMIDTLLIIL